ncbi:MAG: TonB C-terminal domain-containing protein [Pseudomonadota bacterium]|nr:TonB C-terminal domain-containing protein [Pseudomonadota bacterium]
MNYFAPLLLSLFIHFGIGLSFSNILKIDFDAFNIDSKKPITAFVIFEEAISIPRQKIKADQVTKISDKPKLEIEKIELESKKDLLSEIQQLENLKINDQAYINNISLGEIEKFSSIIKKQVVDNWNKPKGISQNLKTEIEIDMVPTGEILSYKILKGSGNEAFDESAMKAISLVNTFDGLVMQPKLFDDHFRKFILIFSPE